MQKRPPNGEPHDSPIISDLEKCYTTKRYSTKRIPQNDLNVVFKALSLSPSSINSQPWKFIVIESDEAKELMHNTSADKFHFNQPHIKTASHVILFAYNPEYTCDDNARVIDADIKNGRTQAENREQAFCVFAFVDMSTDEQGNNGRHRC